MLLKLTVVLLMVVSAAAAVMPDLEREYYMANDSLLGREVPCSVAEKQCLSVNRLLHAETHRCYPLGHGPKNCRFIVDHAAFAHGGGNLRGVCADEYNAPSCRSDDVPMAFDGRCLRRSRALRLCAGNFDLELSLHFFGGFECLHRPLYHKHVHIAQPKKHGKCVFPNLRHDITSIRAVETSPRSFSCSPEQRGCFLKNEVFFPNFPNCYPLLEKGPCGEGERLVLTTKASKSGEEYVESICLPVNPCPNPDERLMAFDGRCHDANEIRAVLCPSAILLPNAFGEMSCLHNESLYRHGIALSASHATGTCDVVHKTHYHHGLPVTRVVPDCELTDTGECTL